MAKYNVTFSCGHTERKDLFGSERERRAKIEYWGKSGKCTECYEKEKYADCPEEKPETDSFEGRKAAIKKVAEETELPYEALEKIFMVFDAEQYLKQTEAHADTLKASPDKTGKHENAYAAAIWLGSIAKKYGL